MQYSREQIENAVKAKGYIWFDKGNYNLNIVGIRNSDTYDEVTNKFDDLMTVSYMLDGEWYCCQYDATTDPGKYYTENLLNEDGVAILVPDQYRSTYSTGMHRGVYEALVQIKPVMVYRDDNLDLHYDKLNESIQEGMFGINIHRANKWGTSTQIDKWSAGCNVIANNEDFLQFMNLVNSAKDIWGNSFTYTLIESADIV